MGDPFFLKKWEKRKYVIKWRFVKTTILEEILWLRKSLR